MPHVTVGRWGKNLAIRLPAEIVKAVGFRDGEHVEIETHDGDIVMRRIVPRFTLEELFQGKTPEDWRAAYAGAFDWGRLSAARWSRNDGTSLPAGYR